MGIHACDHCEKGFTTLQLLQEHVGIFHQTLKFKLGEEEHRVEPSEDGEYHCPCPYHKEPSRFPDSKIFSRHVKLAMWIFKNVDTTGNFIGVDLFENRLLETLNLALNLQHRFLLCLACSHAVQTDQVPSHMKNCNPATKLPQEIIEELQSLLKDFKISQKLPELSGKQEHQVSGLAVKQGYACSFCASAYLIQDTLVRHFREKHQGQKAPNPKDCIQSLQRFQNRNNSPWFYVDQTESKFEPVDILSSLQELFKQETPNIYTNDPRNVCAWLRFSKYDKLVQGQDPDQVRKLASTPNENEFPNLREAVSRFFEQALGEIKNVSDLSLQIINTEDIDRLKTG